MAKGGGGGGGSAGGDKAAGSGGGGGGSGAVGDEGSTRSSVDSASHVSQEEKLEMERNNWKFTQWFKKMPVEDTLPDSDLLSAVEFNGNGEFLATGDKGGRVVVLRADENKSTGKIHYKFHCEFQSHEPEFDYVRSQAIEEKINKIKWCRASNDAQFMLTTNDRAIKLWKLHEKDIKFASGFNVTNDKGQVKPNKKVKTLRLPKTEVVETLVTATPKRFYGSDIHKFNIHSLCVSNDGETFLSADNLCINQWHMDEPNLSYNIVNIKPEDMSKLTEVITATEMDNDNNHLFMYGTNRGVVRLGDMREKALSDLPSREFTDPALEALDKKAASTGAAGGSFPNRPFLSDMLRSISDVKFAQQGRQIVARDYMTIKIWDLAMEKKPVEIIPVHDYLNPKLWDLYENEYIFDCFDLSVNRNGDILTGSYNNYFHVYDMDRKSDTLVEASKPPIATMPITHASGGTVSRDSRTKSIKKKRMSRPGIVSLLGRKKKSKEGGSGGAGGAGGAGKVRGEAGFAEIDVHSFNYDKRILQLAWHPDCKAVAVAGENNLFIYAR